MLEVFAYKQYKKHKLTKKLREVNAKEALSKEDEEFIRRSLDNKKHSSSGQSMFKFLNKKNGEKKGAIVPPTEEELAAVNSKESGLSRPKEETDVPGTTTPTSQEEDLQRALSSLNLAVEKVAPTDPKSTVDELENRVLFVR